MKIHLDKVETGPPHGLSLGDVKCILASVPPEWAQRVKEVRLANGPGPRAYLFSGDGRLTIYSRGHTKRQVLDSVLSTIAAPSLNIASIVAHRPSRADQHRIDQLIQPLIEKILPMLEPKQKQSPEAHTAWHPMVFPSAGE